MLPPYRLPVVAALAVIHFRLCRTESGLHLFTTDTAMGIVNTSLVYYHSPDVPNGTFTFVRQVACCSEGPMTGHRASLWAPMPVYDEPAEIWRLFYVQYSSSIPASNSSGWFYNYDGQIASAVSATKGRGGIGGPYTMPGAGEPAVVLKPGADSQSWEGLQGTDSISPPYLLPDNKTWAAFYGSAQTEKVPNPKNIVSCQACVLFSLSLSSKRDVLTNPRACSPSGGTGCARPRSSARLSSAGCRRPKST